MPGEATVWGAQSISEPETEWIPDQLAAAGLEEAETMTQEDSFSAEEPAARTVGADLSLHIEVPVKDLAAVFKTRIELRQIGVRMRRRFSAASGSAEGRSAAIRIFRILRQCRSRWLRSRTCP